jgi:NAD(P)-dependent dehydrogenase (short-subunit alcohol dehydrogenase family)
MDSVLITGANSGFGRLIAETLATQGYTVSAGIRESAGRNADAARALTGRAREAGWRLDVVELDVADDASVRGAVGRTIERAGCLDVVVNNAGFGAMGLTECYTDEQIRAVFETNVLGANRVARAALPHMRERRRGLLVAISSTLAQLALPFSCFYTASKRALEAVAEMYRYEAGAFGVDSVILEAGAFPTSATLKNLLPADAARAASYGAVGELPDQIFGAFEERLRRPGGPDPQVVADAVAALIATPHGARPLRTVVDATLGAGVEAINAVKASVQQRLLANIGLRDHGAAPAGTEGPGTKS